jgi:predicted nuclease of restriction endonuclease-like (RecB) superfamily
MEQNEANGGLIKYKEEFETVCDIIFTHKKRAMKAIHNESLNMLWEVGAYVSKRLKNAIWGDGVVRMLAEYIHTRNPKAKGWSYRTIYKMVQFYDTYSSDAFKEIVNHYAMHNPISVTGSQKMPQKEDAIVPIELAQIQSNEFVPIELAQIPSVLFSTGWSNHQLIMSQCRTDEQRLFYMLYAGREQLEYKELLRALKTDAMSSILGSKDVQSAIMKREYPQSGVLFKDTVYLEMFGLPVKYKESKLRKEIVNHMKDFILEMGKDFLFIDEEHRVTVGSKTFKVDLLFYHRLLQCMVAIELKTTEFHPKDLGQLEFYLEALDQEERRSNENPSIGIILCKDADMEVVRYALNRSMSPTMVALYKEQLQVGSVIQRSLVEFCKFLNEEKERSQN